MTIERFDDGHYIWMLEKDQPAVAVVVRQRTEGLRSNCDLGVQLETGLEGDGHAAD